MKIGIGYSDNPDSSTAGVHAAAMAIEEAGRNDPCDIVLLFSTARHDQQVLREGVVSVTGAAVPIYGGGAVGIITNNYFGYAGDQIALACIWLDGVGCRVLTEGGLEAGEEAAGMRLGQQLAAIGINPDSPVMLFYDALDCAKGIRMLMATWLLAGIEKGLGFLPDLTGAGMQADFNCSPTKQWIGNDLAAGSAIALAFSGDIRIDSVIMHGCRPATQYYTVTKAAGPVILEINGKPAIQFVDEVLKSAITPDQYPFFLIFGVNNGDRWGEYNEDYYASRLCLGIDKESGGIVMFEPDMVEGTEFQIMYRSLELGYIKPKIDKIFNDLDRREPVFAVYINCAGRAAGYAGMDLEDALVIQQTVAGRAPLLGMYTGVEIASIGGRPRGLDWTGVFCLFSQSKNAGNDGAIIGDAGVSGGKNVPGINSGRKTAQPLWETNAARPVSKEIPLNEITDAMARLCEHNAAKILALDTSLIEIRSELEQKRQGFRLLSELSVSLRQNAGYENVFIPAAKRINAALNMQRTVVLVPVGRGFYKADVLQGYSVAEKAKFAGMRIKVDPLLLDADNPVLVTGADPQDRFGDFRKLLGLPYFISSPVIIQNDVFAILVTGRITEAPPYLVRLSRSDTETVQAISALLASVIAGHRLEASEERNRIMVNNIPICCAFWDEKGNPTDCNRETLSMFGLKDKNEFMEKFYSLSPEYQDDGRNSRKAVKDIIKNVVISGSTRFSWTHKSVTGEIIPVEVTLIRVPMGEDYILAGYMLDLREQKEVQEAAERYAKAKNDFLASVSHEIRTPLNAISAMARIAGERRDLNEKEQNLINQGMSSVKLLTSAIETILDFSRLDSGQLLLETGEFSVRKIIEEIYGIVKNDADKKSLAWSMSVDADVPEILLGDSAKLQHAVMNVVMNAVKFTESGSVEIRVSGEKMLQDNAVFLVIEVKDTGIGISDDQKTELFKPLYVGDITYTRKYGGLGMGLPVSKGLITLMGGEIECESRPGKGSIFRIIIPAALPEKTGIEEAAGKTAGIETLRGMRVLVAEDNDINQMIAEEMLTSAGIETTIVNNGIEALEKFRQKSFDIILMDIQMPEMDGLTTAAQIRSLEAEYPGPDTPEIPIIAMTANSRSENIEESLQAGMNDHLTKPIDVNQLYMTLKKWGKR